jgi:hypothetical protein
MSLFVQLLFKHSAVTLEISAKKTWNLHVKYLLLLADFNSNWNISRTFSKFHSNVMKYI